MTPKIPAAAVVGTVHSPAALQHALRLRRGAVDLLELRVDHFAPDLGPLEKALPRLRFPYIVTVRHPQEGGANNLSGRARMHLYERFLKGAAYIDLELRSTAAFAPLRAAAQERGVRVILSQHYFAHTPSLAVLRAKLRSARRLHADLFKIATRTESAADAARLLLLLQARADLPASVMGMGRLGKASRLLLANAGSALNYGYLGEAQVSGQWPAELFKKRLEETA